MVNWLKSESGNHLVELENLSTMPDENDYARCDECGEQTHIDFMVNRADEFEVCQWCFAKMENEFFCNECCEEFLFKGVPAVCPRCGSLRIWHEFTSGNILVKEKQREHRVQLETRQQQTAKILPFVPRTLSLVQSTKGTLLRQAGEKNKSFTTESTKEHREKMCLSLFNKISLPLL